jgi:hypothetical protein
MLFKHFVVVIVSLILFTSCGTTKETVDFAKVRNGEQLKKVNELTVEQFLQLWIKYPYPVQIDNKYNELYKDENFTYFGKANLEILRHEPNLFKVNNDSLKLKLGNYKKIDGNDIRKEFWKQIVPKTDIDTWKNAECKSMHSTVFYNYELVGYKISIELIWTAKCDKRLISKKKYSGYYDLKSMKIKK